MSTKSPQSNTSEGQVNPKPTSKQTSICQSVVQVSLLLFWTSLVQAQQKAPATVTQAGISAKSPFGTADTSVRLAAW